MKYPTTVLQIRQAPQTTMMSRPSRRAWRRSCCSFSGDFLTSGMFLKQRKHLLLSRLFQPLVNQFRRIFHWQRAVVEDGFVEAAQVKLVAQLALDLLAQPIERGAAN